MREIKFRAWWREAKLLEEVVTLRDGEISILVPLKPNSLGQKYEHQTLEEGQYDLTQFTGLHDKNGKPIYEGDILQWGTPRFPDGQIAEVSWDAEKARFLWEYVGLTKNQCKKLTVIGNIYESPELLAAPHNH